MKPAGASEYTLLLISSRFPFGSGESFIDNEIGYLEKEFRRIIIISQDIKGIKRADISEEIRIYRYNPVTSLAALPYIPLILLRNLKKIISLWNNEAGFRKTKSRSINPGNRLILLKRIIKAVQLGEYIKTVLKQEGINDRVVLYSYWLNTGAHAAALFNTPRLVKIARAHGSDLYEEKSQEGFLPLLNYCSSNLDAIFFVSDDGLKYFMSKYTGAHSTLMVSRLGVRTGEGRIPEKPDRDRFVIVSCSNIIPLKRIDLLIRALAIVRSSRKIHWIHFGEGYLREEIVSLASDELGGKNNIEYEFRGQVPNDQIMKFYSENSVDLFINTSLTEGLPVSIMEAQLHGIPAIATDVGGTRELVTSETGKLLPAEVTAPGLASAIEEFIGLPPEEYWKFRESCRKNCVKNFDAGINYSGFILKLNSILASRREAEIN